MMAAKSTAWQRLPIVGLCEVHVDCINRTAPVVAEPTPFKMLRTTNVRSGYIDVTNVRYVTEETYKKWTRRLVPKRGDIILTREAPLGDVGKIRTDDAVFLGQRLYHFRPDPKKLDADFLLYSLLADDLQSQIRGYGSGSTVEHMRLEDIPCLEFNVPPLPVQQRIAGILSAYDELIENSQRRIKILESMARALYREWFVHFRFPGHDNSAGKPDWTAEGRSEGASAMDGASQSVPRVTSAFGEIPKGWDVKKLGDVVELNYGKALKKEDRRDGDVPVFGSSGIVGTHDAALVAGPGIVVGRKGNVGSVFWCDEDFFVIDTAYFVTSRLPLRYMFYVLPTLNFINSDAAVPGLSRNQAYSLDLLVPPDGLLQEFCELAGAFESQAGMLRRQIQNLRRTRDLLLPRLLSGQIDVEALADA